MVIPCGGNTCNEVGNTSLFCCRFIFFSFGTKGSCIFPSSTINAFLYFFFSPYYPSSYSTLVAYIALADNIQPFELPSNSSMMYFYRPQETRNPKHVLYPQGLGGKETCHESVSLSSICIVKVFTMSLGKEFACHKMRK